MPSPSTTSSSASAAAAAAAAAAADYAETSNNNSNNNDNNNKQQTSFHLFEGWKQEERQNFFDKLLFRRGSGGGENADDKQQQQEEDDQQQDAIEQIQGDDDDDQQKNQGWSVWVNAVKSLVTSSKQKDDKNNDDDDEGISIQVLVEKARDFQQQAAAADNSNNNNNTPKDNIETLQKEIKMVWEQMTESFGDDKNITDNMKLLLNPVSFQYFLEKDESVKTPSWKRRKHRFQPELKCPQQKVYALHDALYLAETSYLDSVEEITNALHNYHQGDGMDSTATTNDSTTTTALYELVYCNTQAEPRQPAHYIALKKKAPLVKKKVSSSLRPPLVLPWQQQKQQNTNNVLHVLMVVRGTKDFSDMLSDCLLKSREFGDGYAHDGVCASGEFLVDKHSEFLHHFLEESGCAKIKLSLIGHSLGAGAAAVACIEFNTRYGDKIDATCIGFGCPALLSKELSEKWMDRITTVICDADCVPRMSKATVSNLILDVMSNDWTAQALEDVNELVNVVQKNIPLPADKVKEAIGWVTDYLNKNIKPDIAKVTKERSEVELFPPGRCIHFFRDGQGISVRYMSCTFFDQFDVCRTMVDDHLVATGYNRIFHELVRQTTNDSRFFFRNDVNGLRVEKDRKQNSETSGKD